MSELETTPTCYLCGWPLEPEQWTVSMLDAQGDRVEVHTPCWDRRKAERAAAIEEERS